MTNDCCRNMTQAVVNWMLTGFVTFVWVGELGNESALCFLLTWVPNRLHRNWLVLKLHTRTMTQPPGQLSSGPRSPLTLETPQLRGGPGRLRATWLGDSSPGWVPANPHKSWKRLNFIVLIYSTDLKMKIIRILYTKFRPWEWKFNWADLSLNHQLERECTIVSPNALF